MFSSDHYSTQVIDCLLMSLVIIWANKAPREWSIARMYIRKDFPDTGAVRIGGCVRYRLISSNACWQASSQMNETPFFINLVRGWHRPERFEINHRIYANHPCNPLSSLRFLGGCISWMARTFFGSKWIPLFVMTNPRNLLLATPRKDLVGFIFNWCAHMISILSSDLLCDRLWHDFLLQCR